MPLLAAGTKAGTKGLTGAAGFTLISWNIEGLGNDKCGDTVDEIILRTQVAMRELLAQAPTLICLQEVIPETLPTIQRMLGGRYLDVEGSGTEGHGGYFTKMFVKRARGLTVLGASRRPFDAGSTQGRDLLLTTLAHEGIKVCVGTSHLESLKPNMGLRQRQLAEGLQRIETLSAQQGAELLLLVGDLNLSKGDEAPLKETTKGWTDALPRIDGKVAGTWDAKTNKRVQLMVKNNWVSCRFDRCYFKTNRGPSSGGGAWEFRGGSLVGTQPSDLLEHGYASDHYGLGLVWEHPTGFAISPQGAFSPLLDVPKPYDNDSQSVRSSEWSAASTKSAASSRTFIPRKDCTFWLKGRCHKGETCTYKHDPQKAGTQGTSSGDVARFRHAKEEGPAASVETSKPTASSKSKQPPRGNTRATAASKNMFSMLEEGEGDE